LKKNIGERKNTMRNKKIISCLFLTIVASLSFGSNLLSMHKNDHVKKENIKAKEKEDVCAICIEELNGYRDIASLPCEHQFCRNCITTWVKEKKDSWGGATCPMCRKSIRESDIKKLARPVKKTKDKEDIRRQQLHHLTKVYAERFSIYWQIGGIRAATESLFKKKEYESDHIEQLEDEGKELTEKLDQLEKGEAFEQYKRLEGKMSDDIQQSIDEFKQQIITIKNRINLLKNMKKDVHKRSPSRQPNRRPTISTHVPPLLPVMQEEEKEEEQCLICGNNLYQDDQIITYEDCKFHRDCFSIQNSRYNQIAKPRKPIINRSSSMVTRHKKEKNEELCSICRDPHNQNSIQTKDCKHKFHAQCLYRWLERGGNTCPNCRVRIKETDMEPIQSTPKQKPKPKPNKRNKIKIKLRKKIKKHKIEKPEATHVESSNENNRNRNNNNGWFRSYIWPKARITLYTACILISLMAATSLFS